MPLSALTPAPVSTKTRSVTRMFTCFISSSQLCSLVPQDPVVLATLEILSMSGFVVHLPASILNYNDHGSSGHTSREEVFVRPFLAPWPQVSVASVIDVLLVAVVIYEFLALIRGTRAALMLIGVAALALAIYFSRIGELPTLNWLISHLLPYTVFGLIVIFQAEIRQSLARLGRKLSFRNALSSEGDAYDDIVLAANL